MRPIMALTAVLLLSLGSIPAAVSADTEQEIVEQFLKQRESRHPKRIGYISGNFVFNRINRDNDYNKFANHTSQHFADTDIPWIGDAKGFGLELGTMVGRRFSWSVGGEYWLKMGVNESGSFDYAPPDGIPTVVTDLVSEVQVWGLTSSLQYYLYNPPANPGLLNRPAVRLGATIGYFQATWDVWDSYQNLNLSTSLPEGANTTYKGSAPGGSVELGFDLPLSLWGMVLGTEVGYLYLNFTNVAWYNSSDQEVVVTYDESAEARVDLDFSGFTGKAELKRFFKL